MKNSFSQSPEHWGVSKAPLKGRRIQLGWRMGMEGGVHAFKG